jgi:hypothetical protein
VDAVDAGGGDVGRGGRVPAPLAEDGSPQPAPGQKREEEAPALTQHLTANGLPAMIRADAAGFRMVAVSYCSHDIYSATSTFDPYNPNRTPDGELRRTNGTLATKAAIAFTQAKYPTTKTFLHSGSAGSVGTFSVAYAMELEGVPPAGIVADARVVNQEALAASFAQGVCVDRDSVPDCSMHVVTPRQGVVNTDPQSPGDYNGAIIDWVHARLAEG